MKNSLHTTFLTAVAAIAVVGCDATPPADPAVPSAADSAGEAAEPGADLTYEAIVALIGEPDDFAKARKLGALLPTLGPGSVPAVKAALEEAWVLEMGAVEFELLMHYWAAHEPAEAGFYALATAPRGYAVAAIFAAITPWARANPQEALQTVGVWSLAGGDAGAAAQIALVRGWFEGGKPGLEEYIRDLGAGFERQRALMAYAIAKIRKDGPEAVVSWAEALPEDDAAYKLEAFRQVGTALPPFDLEVARHFCDTHCEGTHGSNLRSNIAGRWALDDPSAALEWLSTAPDNWETGFAVRTAFAVWGSKDRQAALTWMRAKIAGGEQPPAWLRTSLPIYAQLLGKDSPTEGLVWAARLEDPKDREWVSLQIARGWRLKDEAAAEAWLRESSLSEESLARVRAPETKVERNHREGAERREKTQPKR